jgi:hypothetical protein
MKKFLDDFQLRIGTNEKNNLLNETLKDLYYKTRVSEFSYILDYTYDKKNNKIEEIDIIDFYMGIENSPLTLTGSHLFLLDNFTPFYKK